VQKNRAVAKYVADIAFAAVDDRNTLDWSLFVENTIHDPSVIYEDLKQGANPEDDDFVKQKNEIKKKNDADFAAVLEQVRIATAKLISS
jgi:hypothetical protein